MDVDEALAHAERGRNFRVLMTATETEVVLAAEVRRLREESPYYTCACGRQIHVPALTELGRLREMEGRARSVVAEEPRDPVEAGEQGVAKYILGEGT